MKELKHEGRDQFLQTYRYPVFISHTVVFEYIIHGVFCDIPFSSRPSFVRLGGLHSTTLSLMATEILEKFNKEKDMLKLSRLCRAGGLVQWLKLLAWKVGDRGF